MTPAAIPEERGRSSGFVVTSNKARRGMSISVADPTPEIQPRKSNTSSQNLFANIQKNATTSTPSLSWSQEAVVEPASEKKPSQKRSEIMDSSLSNIGARRPLHTMSAQAAKSLVKSIFHTVRFGHSDSGNNGGPAITADDSDYDDEEENGDEADGGRATIGRSLVTVVRERREQDAKTSSSNTRPIRPSTADPSTSSRKSGKKGIMGFASLRQKKNEHDKNGADSLPANVIEEKLEDEPKKLDMKRSNTISFKLSIFRKSSAPTEASSSAGSFRRKFKKGEDTESTK
jgi:hypothetical protein